MGPRLRRVPAMLALGASVWSAAIACTFPSFVVLPDGAVAGGSAGAGGVSVGGSSSQTAANGGSQAAMGGTGTGAVGQAGAAGMGEPVPVDIGPCGQRPHPVHCWNQKLDEDETDVDCGGPRCEPCGADELCTDDDDCGTGSCSEGKCARSFELSYLQKNPNLETTSLRFEIVLAYSKAEAIPLQDVTVRYYFSRNEATEPLLPTASGTQQPTGSDLSSALVLSVVRQLRGNGASNDAYFEIGFEDGRILSAGQTLTLNGQLVTGDANGPFNQSTHHSWDDEVSLHESKKLSVHVDGKRVWGRGPDIDNPPSCFQEGVNLDGAALMVGDAGWLTSPASVLSRYQDNLVALKPETDKGREEMLRSGFLFKDDSFSYPVDNGSYALLVYAWSASGGETGTLRVNDEAFDRFHALSFDGGSPWVPLGPYRVTIEDGMLELGAQGTLRVGGIELRLLDE